MEEILQHTATKEDFEAIEEALEAVWKPELDFIFKDKSRIENALVITYDKDNIYYWRRENGKFERFTIPHTLKLTLESIRGMRTNFKLDGVYNLLPKELQSSNYPIFSGGLLTEFIEMQKTKPVDFNPNTTRESYLATIVHEFGHVYYNSFGNHYFDDKEEALNYIQTAIEIITTNNSKSSNIKVLKPRTLTELFAFCTELASSQVFWPNHVENVKKNLKHILPMRLEEMKNIDPRFEDTFLNSPHGYADVMGIILLHNHPTDWPEVLLSY